MNVFGSFRFWESVFESIFIVVIINNNKNELISFCFMGIFIIGEGEILFFFYFWMFIVGEYLNIFYFSVYLYYYILFCMENYGEMEVKFMVIILYFFLFVFDLYKYVCIIIILC